MTALHVRRVTIVLCAVFVLAAVAFAALARHATAPPARMEPPAAATGAAAFRERCAPCHAAPTIAEMVGQAPNRAAKLAEIGALLTSGHGNARRDEVSAILAYLDGLAGR